MPKPPVPVSVSGSVCVPCRLAAIGAVVPTLAGGFAYTAGWLSPARLTTSRIVNTFQAAAGQPHPGYRRNHAKGLCVEGYFDSNGDGAVLSSAAVFAPGRTPVTGRFAIPGGNPSAPDTSTPVRSLALLFQLPNGEQWRTGMNSTPVFAVHTPEQFYQQLLAAKPDPATGKPDPAKLKAFYAANPETQPFQAWVKGHPPSSSLANGAYYGINAFLFTDRSGNTRAVRWAMVPDTPYAPITDAQKAAKNYLAADLNQRLDAGPLRWHLILTVAQPGDPTGDATLQWPDDRQHIDAGTLVLEHTTSQEDGTCRDVNFDPTVLPSGIKPSDDPLLAARSAAYAVSYQRRTREEALNPALHRTQANGDRS
ncbi:catalase family peroxidase [Paraburkholderia bryophila]|uniref:catalase family peroxidase n=1 Tax=Paraburkholderia bryophila TaxID=420952 RepID=UPI0023490A60|nr:catalase family peroxidase [Paraburkholderia bryophila]WCM22194.1 catalase family peroxidase [Paraburkholderia bryophila]